MTARHLLRSAAVGAIASLPASFVKALAEPPLQRQVERILPPEPWQKRLVGADPYGRPDNMPPAVLASEVDELRGGPGLDAAQKARASTALHYAFGAAAGAAYGVIGDRIPAVTRGAGAPAGIVVYASTHAGALPALNIQEAPWDLPPAAVVWEVASHVVFGVTLELGRRVLDRVLP